MYMDDLLCIGHHQADHVSLKRPKGNEKTVL